MTKEMSFFEVLNYRELVKQRIKSLPKEGYGQLIRLSENLSVHSSLISQVLNGNKNFTMEQALKVTLFFGFSEREKDYFLLLVQLERAGDKDLRAYFARQIDVLRLNNDQIISRRNKPIDFSDEAKALYYSDWNYMAVWLAASIESISTKEEIGHKLGIDRANINRIVEFLVSTGLCKETENRLRPRITNTHLAKTSPLINRHHINWRLKAIESFPRLSDEALSFTAPVSLSRQDFIKIKRVLLDAIEGISATVEASEPQTIAYLNIDWHELVRHPSNRF